MKKIINYLVSVLIIIILLILYRFYSKNDDNNIKIVNMNTTINNLNTKINDLDTKNKELLEEKKIEEEKNNIKFLSKSISNKATKIPIITLHRVVKHDIKVKYFKDNKWVNDAKVVEEQLKYLYDNNWKSIDLDEFYDWYNKDIEVEEKSFVLTIDDGDAEAYYILLPLLEKYNFKATLFSIGSSIPLTTDILEEPTRKKLGLDIIEKLRKDNSLLQVESHSYNLHYTKNNKRAVHLKNKKELEEDFRLNEKYNFKYMAYPYGHYNDAILEVASNSNIKMIFGFDKSKYATRLDSKYNVSRLKVTGLVTLKEFKKLFNYAK